MQKIIIIQLLRRLLPVIVGALGGAAVTYGILDQATVDAIVDVLEAT